MGRLKDHVWLGNIRELRNVLMQAALLAGTSPWRTTIFRFVERPRFFKRKHSIPVRDINKLSRLFKLVSADIH